MIKKHKKNRQMKKIVVNGQAKYVYSDILEKEFLNRTGQRGCCGKKGNVKWEHFLKDLFL